VPKSATFVGVAHYSKTGPSLTSVGWNSSLASDGLRIPGGVQGTFEDFTPGSIEALWHAAFPPGTLRGRIGYGLYGVSGSGYWAVIYSRHRQIEALMAHGADARAAGALTWPTLAVGLSVADMKRRWPALGFLDTPATTRCVVDPPLYTPTALVHRLLVLGIAPITPVTANLTLIGRQSMVFEGVPWFAFHRVSAPTPEVVEVDVAGIARRLGSLGDVGDLILERCWGVTESGQNHLRSVGVVLPRSVDLRPDDYTSFRRRLGCVLAMRSCRISAPEIESLLVPDAHPLSPWSIPPSIGTVIAAVAASQDVTLRRDVGAGGSLLLRSPNGPAPRQPRLGGRQVRNILNGEGRVA